MMTAPAFFRGEWLEPGDPGYDESGLPFNLLREQYRPRAIARCLGESDVITALATARTEGLEVAVRATGMSLPGFSTTEGLLIDLSLMRSVRIDPIERTAWVGGGVNGGDLQIEGHRYGLAAATGALSTAGMGLLLGGGLGNMSSRVGYSSDSILAVELVTANGESVVASADVNPDLFWAVRGAGANFGVVTALKLRLYEVPPVLYAGSVSWERPRMREALENLRRMAPSISDDLDLLGLAMADEFQLWICHIGTPEEARAEVGRLLADCPPDREDWTPMSFRDLTFHYDDEFPPQRVFAQEETFAELTDELIDLVLEASAVPVPEGSAALRQIEVGIRNGALCREPEVPSVVHPSAVPHGWNVLPGTWWKDAAEDAGHIAWLHDTIGRMRGAGAQGGAIVPSMVGIPSSEELVERAYGDRLPRLRELKHQWDPENVFRANLNVRPA